MLDGRTILLASFAYLALLFGIAFYGDRRASAGRSLIANPYFYALSLGVYATAFSFYGAVGRAANTGVAIVAMSIGPTLFAALGWMLLRKMIRISKTNRITSIADFIGWRYGKSSLLAAMVTLVALVGVIPYVALQLKAVADSYAVLAQYPDLVARSRNAPPILEDTAFYVALLLALFAMLFGTRHLDASERHEGMVAAIAFESIVKLGALLAVGAFVVFSTYDGFADLFARAAAAPELRRLLTLEATPGGAAGWTSLMLVSMLAILCFPRQFQLGVVENVSERHVRKAIWLLPVYSFVLNIFLLPIALGGLLRFPGGSVDPDTFVLALPMSERQEWLALVVFIGGLSAATAMVIVESIALATMICNDLTMPLLLRVQRLRLASRPDVSGLVLAIRRAAIVLLLALAYAYYRATFQTSALASILFVAFVALVQIAPALLGGMYWKHGTKAGAIVGMSLGIAVWGYTMLLPAFADAELFSRSLIEQGPFGIAWLRPQHLFGLGTIDPLTQSLYWTLLVNVGAYVAVSLSIRPRAGEQVQALLFVDAFRVSGRGAQLWRGSTSLDELRMLARRFLGPARADEAFARYAVSRGAPDASALEPDAELVQFVESLLVGTIGAASARVMVATAVREEPLGIDEVMSILDETSQLIVSSRMIEEKSRELETVSAELRAANERLKELDRLKDEFLSAVTHEIRTPLASIRALSELLFAGQEIAATERQRFLSIIVSETERLTRLTNQVLDLAKVEAGSATWHRSQVDMKELIDEVRESLRPLLRERRIELTTDLPERVPRVNADRDRLLQVVVNLLSNAVKACEPDKGRIAIALTIEADALRVDIEDNGPGIALADQSLIFEKFVQVADASGVKRPGSGLGLAISRHIVSYHGGRIWVESAPGEGAVFSFTVPRQPNDERAAMPAAALGIGARASSISST
ncbi:MAG TPA: ATP-binding protein [Casimicrobiaceae bacterium]